MTTRNSVRKHSHCLECGYPLPKYKKKFCCDDCFDWHRLKYKKGYLKKYYSENSDRLKKNSSDYYHNNKEIISQKIKKDRESNPDKFREKKFKEKYGIGLQEYENILESQGGVCAICKQNRGTRDRRLDLDHCHSTGKVRGILCEPCNKAIGLFWDNPEWLEDAAKYLKGVANEDSSH